jgi:type II secretory pathway pseudopilin PulG
MKSAPARTIYSKGSRRGSVGAVLLEVLLAVALFAAAAAVATTALNASLESLERQKLDCQALNLATSVMAEIQLGIRSANSTGARPLETPFQEWTWETSQSPAETSTGDLTGLTRVEVIIRHQQQQTIQRLTQEVQLNNVAPAGPIPASPLM